MTQREAQAALLTGKAAFITGAASGIGRAAAELFAEHGARLTLVDLDPAVEAVAEKLKAAGTDAIAVVADVSKEEDVAGAVRLCIESFGGLDCAFNNAGINAPRSTFHELSLETWNRVIGVNLTSVFLCMKHQLAHMVQVGAGSIVNTSSVAGFTAAPGQPHYTASKHGVLGLTKQAAREYAKHGIRVNAVCPGVTDTELVQRSLSLSTEIRDSLLQSLPFGRMGEPREIAQAALWLCSSASSFVSGESMAVDGAGICR